MSLVADDLVSVVPDGFEVALVLGLPRTALQPAVEFTPRSLSSSATIARKDARKRLSPHGTVRCSSLQRPPVRFAGCFSFSHLAATSSAGLLIPRSQVRVLPGPFDFAVQQGFLNSYVVGFGTACERAPKTASAR